MGYSGGLKKTGAPRSEAGRPGHYVEPDSSDSIFTGMRKAFLP